MISSLRRTHSPRLTPPPASYVATDSPLHRLPASIKAFSLILLLIASTYAITSLIAAVIGLSAMVALYRVARIPWRIAMKNITAPLPVILALCALLWWTTGWYPALLRCLSLIIALGLALLLMLCTRVSEMMDSLNSALQPLARWGVPVEAITLAVSLTMRLIPLQLQMLQEVIEARKARGGGASLRALGVPLVVRTLLRARAVGEALISRGVGTPRSPQGK